MKTIMKIKPVETTVMPLTDRRTDAGASVCAESVTRRRPSRKVDLDFGRIDHQ